MRREVWIDRHWRLQRYYSYSTLCLLLLLLEDLTFLLLCVQEESFSLSVCCSCGKTNFVRRKMAPRFQVFGAKV